MVNAIIVSKYWLVLLKDIRELNSFVIVSTITSLFRQDSEFQYSNTMRLPENILR